MTEHFAGFDIGGTKTLAVLMDSERTVIRERKVPRPRSPEDTVAQLSDLIAEIQDDAQVAVAAVGIGIAGAISRHGSVQFSPNIPEVVDFPLRDRLQEQIQLPTVVDNDATAATWAEHQLGAGQGVDHLLYVALGTGIGTGFVLDGRIYRGAHGFAGESGHIVIERHGATHISGVQGPWEMYASGNGLGWLGRDWASDGRLQRVVEIADGQDVQGEHVSQAIAEGDSDTLALLDVFAGNVAVGLTNLIYVLDPERIVLGGGLVEIGEALRSRVQQQVDATTLGGQFRPDVPVVLAELGSRSGALGAAMLARELVSPPSL